MSQRRSLSDAIRLRGVRHNNLKNFDLDIPLGKLTVVTGLSGSGKSSLAFDTLFAEGQRRYIETFSPYARQFFDRMDKPQVDRIEGIPPAIAIEQRNAVRSTRSTVGTMTEICDYLKVLWPHLAELRCRECGQLVQAEPPQVVWARVNAQARNTAEHEHDDASQPSTPAECLITFDLPLSDRLSIGESLELIARQGYQRLFIDGDVVRLEEAAARLENAAPRVTVVQDRLKITASNRARFVEACEQAYHFGKGRLALRWVTRASRMGANAAAKDLPANFDRLSLFSSDYHCATCDLDYPEPTPALFSFNHPVGACPACKGFGRIISIDYQRALPDRSKTLAGGVIKPWQTGMSADCQTDLRKACKARGLPMDVPFAELSEHDQRWVIEGDEGYNSDDPENSWPRKWYGVKGYFRWLESKSYKMHVRVLLSRYRAYTTCQSCGGQRLKPDAVRYRVALPGNNGAEPALRTRLQPQIANAKPQSLSLPEFYALPIERALTVIQCLAASRTGATWRGNDPVSLALHEVRTRLQYLVDVGLGYLTLDRPTRTLSGGETERVNLTTCLGTRLVNTLFVLDEPSVGLHPRDTARLVRILEQLRDTGNTVVVVEHEAGVIRAADQVVDLGPGQGEKGGEVVFTGPLPDLLRCERSLTGNYLSGRRKVEVPSRRPVSISHESKEQSLAEATVPYRIASETLLPSPNQLASQGALKISRATRNNLRNVTVEIPLGRMVALTGVSGSGKTTLIREILLPALQARLKSPMGHVKASDRLDTDADNGAEEDSNSNGGCVLDGWESLEDVVLVDQAPLGKTPRSNPVVYIGAFDDVRELFAQTDLARQRGLNGSAFSFNSGVGQCERCRGAGFEKIEMQFLSDVFIRCPECDGRRYRGHILEVRLRGPVTSRAWLEAARGARRNSKGRRISEPSQVSNTDSDDAVGVSTAEWSIADMLEATVDDAVYFLTQYLHVPAGRRAVARLKLLQDVGLGYLRLGQPINTLSGGESQRLKLVSHLGQSVLIEPPAESTSEAVVRTRNTRGEVVQWLSHRARRSPNKSRKEFRNGAAEVTEGSNSEEMLRRGTLFLFDEPTTGLHFEDVRILLQVFQRIVDAGHSVVVIEHNLDVIKCADWVIEMGPEAGEGGGQIVAVGSPEVIAQCEASHTGHYLKTVLSNRSEPARSLPNAVPL